MKVYKNPFVSRECYFVKTGKGHSYKMEASKSKGYIVEFIDGKRQLIGRKTNDIHNSILFGFCSVLNSRNCEGVG